LQLGELIENFKLTTLGGMARQFEQRLKILRWLVKNWSLKQLNIERL